MIKVCSDHFPNASYLKKAYESILETFDDATTYPRQYFLQLLNTPNVRTLRCDSKPDSWEACIEIQPNSSADLQHFLDCHSSGEFRSMLQNNLKVNGASFVGRVEVYVDTEYCQQLVNATKESATAPGKHPPRVRSLIAICATEICQLHLDKSHLSAFRYLRTVKKAGCPDLLTQIRTSDGYNALHLAVKYESEELLKLVFYSNKWEDLRNDVVKPTNLAPGSLHVGYTPRRLAEALAYKDSGYRILTAFDQYDGIFTRLPSIHRACLAGSLPLTSALVDADPSLLEDTDDDGANCLLYASAAGSAKLVDYLLTKGVPSNVQNKAGETPCHLAVMFGHLAVLEQLSMHFFDIRGAVGGRGYSALHYGARYGDLDVLRFYKDKGFRLDCKALVLAAKYRQSDALEFILDAITDVNMSSDEDGRFALHQAALNGDFCAVRRLLERGADITLVDRGGMNALHFAARAGCREVARILVDEAKRIGRLTEVVSSQDVFLGEDLMTVIRGKDRGRRAWHIVELDPLRVKAFREALRSGRLDVAEYGRIVLSGFGTAPDQKTNELMRRRLRDVAADRKPHMTPLHVATLHRRYDVVDILLRNEARPNDVDHHGATAMHYAAMNDDVGILELLYKADASLDVKTADGKSPYDVADDNRSRASINFFHSIKPVKLAKVCCEEYRLQKCFFGSLGRHYRGPSG